MRDLWSLEAGAIYLNHGTAEFDWTGTRDPSPFLSLPAALDFLASFGADAVRDYNHDLAVDAAAMALAPLPEKAGAGREEAEALRNHLLYTDNIEVPIIAWSGRLWARLAVQVYCQMSDFEALADALEAWTAER